VTSLPHVGDCDRVYSLTEYIYVPAASHSSSEFQLRSVWNCRLYGYLFLPLGMDGPGMKAKKTINLVE